MEFEDLKRMPHSLEAEQSIIGSLIVAVYLVYCGIQTILEARKSK